jgi:hypothetical protein
VSTRNRKRCFSIRPSRTVQFSAAVLWPLGDMTDLLTCTVSIRLYHHWIYVVYIYIYIYLFIYDFVYLFIYVLIYLFMYSFIYLFIHLFMYSFIYYLCIHLFIYSFIYLSIHLFVYSFMYIFICWFIYIDIHIYHNIYTYIWQCILPQSFPSDALWFAQHIHKNHAWYRTTSLRSFPSPSTLMTLRQGEPTREELCTAMGATLRKPCIQASGWLENDWFIKGVTLKPVDFHLFYTCLIMFIL